MHFIKLKQRERDKFKMTTPYIPILTKPLLLNSVPMCGPDNERKVCKRGKIERSCGRESADRTIIVPNNFSKIN